MNISAGMTGFEEDILGVQEFTPPKKLLAMHTYIQPALNQPLREFVCWWHVPYKRWFFPQWFSMVLCCLFNLKIPIFPEDDFPLDWDCGVGGVRSFCWTKCEGILTYSTHKFGNRKADLSLVTLDFFCWCLIDMRWYMYYISSFRSSHDFLEALFWCHQKPSWTEGSGIWRGC